MDELIKGLESGLQALPGALLVLVPALVSYACFNGFKNKTLVLFVGTITIPIVAFFTGFNFYFIQWNNVGSALIILYSTFGIGIFLAYHFPWHEKQTEKMLTSKEVADILSISEETVIRWVEIKFIFGINHGNGATIPQDSLIKWLKKFSNINALAHKDDRIHWINKNMIEKVHAIRSQKEAMV